MAKEHDAAGDKADVAAKEIRAFMIDVVEWMKAFNRHNKLERYDKRQRRSAAKLFESICGRKPTDDELNRMTVI